MPGLAAPLLRTCHGALASAGNGTTVVTGVLLGQLSAAALQALSVDERLAVGTSMVQLLKAKSTGA